jgi:hypothetical protein
LGFDNRIDVLKNYELSKNKPKGGNIFYKMLNDYYADDSKYLEDDAVNNQQPRSKGTGYVVLIRYLYSGFNTFFKCPKARTRKRAEGTKPICVYLGTSSL